VFLKRGTRWDPLNWPAYCTYQIPWTFALHRHSFCQCNPPIHHGNHGCHCVGYHHCHHSWARRISRWVHVMPAMFWQVRLRLALFHLWRSLRSSRRHARQRRRRRTRCRRPQLECLPCRTQPWHHPCPCGPRQQVPRIRGTTRHGLVSAPSSLHLRRRGQALRFVAGVAKVVTRLPLLSEWQASGARPLTRHRPPPSAALLRRWAASWLEDLHFVTCLRQPMSRWSGA
jgi:hypothetical protein